MDDQLILAPLRGVTGRTFRETFSRHFAGLDEAVAPFIPTVEGTRVKPALLKDLRPGVASPPLVPQVLGRDPRAFRVMLGALRELGFSHANLNAGCPWPMVVKRGRGSGLLANEAALAGMLETGCDVLGKNFSVKIRLGIDDPTLLLRLMPLINKFPLEELIIHPRTARQMYEGVADVEAFAQAAEACAHRVAYNGDIFSLDDFFRLKQRFPRITRWMIGRGVLRNPLLCESIKLGRELPPDLPRVMAFHNEYLDAVCAELSGDRPVLGRMKELWFYLHHAFPRGAKLLRAIQLCATVVDYRRMFEFN